MNGAVVVALYYWTGVSRVTLFWVAFILMRPLGATVGDFLGKPVADGGLALSRPLASAAIATIIVTLLFILRQRPAHHPGQVIHRQERNQLAPAIDRRTHLIRRAMNLRAYGARSSVAV